MPQLTPDQMFLAGLAIMAAMGLTFHPGVKEKGLLLFEWIRNIGTTKKDVDIWNPDDVLNIGPLTDEINGPNDVHQIVTALAEYFQNEGDIDGVKLTARIGIHIYEHQLASMTKEQENNG